MKTHDELVQLRSAEAKFAEKMRAAFHKAGYDDEFDQRMGILYLASVGDGDCLEAVRLMPDEALSAIIRVAYFGMVRAMVSDLIGDNP